MNLHRHEVGRLFRPGRASWPEQLTYECTRFPDSPAPEHNLFMFLAAPTAHERRAARKTPVQLAVYAPPESPHLVNVLLRIRGLYSWSDAPYSWHLKSPASRHETFCSPGGRLMHLTLVDAATGIVQALRVASMPRPLVEELEGAIDLQRRTPFDRETYLRDLAALHQTHTSEDLARMAPQRYDLGR